MTSYDALKLEQLLSWVNEDTTGAIDWGDGGRYVAKDPYNLYLVPNCQIYDFSVIHFHKTKSHTLVLLKRPASEPRRSSRPRTSFDFGLTPVHNLDDSDMRASLSVPSSSIETVKQTRPRSWY